jgi:uncharacterized membrane protein
MTTLVLLIVSFGVLWLLSRNTIRGYLTISRAGRIAMAVMLLFTGTAHFYKTEEMILMMPGFLPTKTALVYLTGIFEILGAIGLIFERTSKSTSILLILFFLAVLPANIIGAMKRVELGGMENGPYYLYFRIPLQLLFIGWTYYFGISRLHKSTSAGST